MQTGKQNKQKKLKLSKQGRPLGERYMTILYFFQRAQTKSIVGRHKEFTNFTAHRIGNQRLWVPAVIVVNIKYWLVGQIKSPGGYMFQTSILTRFF